MLYGWLEHKYILSIHLKEMVKFLKYRFNSCLVNRKEAEFTIRMPGAKEQRIHETLEGNAGMTRQQEFEKPL